MTRHERHDRQQRNNSATSYHSPRHGSDSMVPTLTHGSTSRNPINVPPRPRHASTGGGFERDNTLPGSYGSYSQSPPLSPPAASNPLMNFGDHRRELSVLQTPQFGIRQNLTPSAASPTFGSMSSVATPALNGNIFDSNEPYSQSTLRPGTAPSSSSASHGLSESYFPDETRRPSVASVITNASSTGSKSSVGRSICKRIFGSGEISGDSAVSSDSSIPPTVTTPRTQYGFQGPGTPTSSRPRTPLPSAEVVPFLYQDLDDIRRIGDAPVHDVPLHDRIRYEPDDSGLTSPHALKLHFRGRNKDRDKRMEKELPPRPMASKELWHSDYQKNFRLNLDGPGSSQSSQTRILRSSSPTPSTASSLSIHNLPRSPGSVDHNWKGKSIWNKVFKKDKERTDNEKEGISSTASGSARITRIRKKASEPMLNSTNGITPTTTKRGSIGNEHMNPRAMDYASVDQIAAAKNASKGSEGRKCNKDQTNYRRLGRGSKGEPPEPPGIQLSTDFSDLTEFVRLQTVHPSLENPESQPNVDNSTWEPPESWGASAVKRPSEESLPPEPEDEAGPEDAPYCIRVFRADSTFATLSCKLQASVTEVLALLGRKSFLQDNLANYQIVMRKNGLLRILGPTERPLKIQKRLFELTGYTEQDHLDEIGREDHGYLVRFTFMMARTGGYSLDQETGLTKVQKFSHVDLQGRNLLTIPITLYHKAPEIISLNLSRNLSLNIPKDFIQQCVNLRKIEFTGNDAERLPNSIAAALRLTYLDISHNRLEDLEHAALEKHGALVALKLSNNRLASLPSAFGLFKSLRSLHLASNYLTTFPQFICDLVTLVELDISFNSIKSFPLQIGQLSALERLNATNNRLTGSLPQTFSMLGSLKELDLRFNLELQNIDVVAELPRLETVVVSHNRVSGFQQSFQKLRALHLNSNPVTRFSIPTVLVTLKFLNLSNAKIAAINDTLFDKLPNLERLILDKNHIVSFPPQIAKLRRLEYLSCNNNELATLPKEIGQLQDLRYLDLHYNNIKVLPGEIWQLTCLVTLNISSNVLKEFPKPPTNTTAVGITVSEAPANPEQTIPEDGIEGEGPETIRRPSQQTGNLLSVGTSPAQNGRKGSMVSIYGQGGRKASVISKSTSDVTVGGSPTVSTPRKDSSSSSRMSYTFVYTLKYLYLADNRLSDEVFEELSLLSELRVLNLSYNDLYDIPPRALSRMPQLNELYLSGNELTSLPAEDLEHIPSLKVLHLNGNKFQTLPAELGKIRKLLVLDVGNNALKYNISNWPYDWNWNWNLDLKYLNLSGNKRLEIKPSRNDPNSAREKCITDFSQMTKLRVLGLMDVTLMIPNIPDQTEDRRVRLSGSMIRSMSYGMADSLGRNEHLSLIDMVVPDFRGARDEWLVGLFDGQSLSTGGSKISKFLHESLEFFLKDELNKLRQGESAGVALHRAFLNLNRELATTAMQTLDDKNVPGAVRNPSIGNGAMLGPSDLNSGAAATVVYMQQNELFVANVGDAMAILIQGNGDHKVLTKKHEPGNTVELDRIREAGGWVSRTGKLNDVLDTSRAFGYFQLVPTLNAAPSIYEGTLQGQEELLILASKELWNYISFQSAVDIVRTEKTDLMRAAHKLRDFAISYGATQKIMVMVLGIGDMRKSKYSGRARSLPFGSGQHLPTDDDLFPTVKVARKRAKDPPDNAGLARLDAEVKAPEGDLAMVFTDIKNSTLMWETYPVAMRTGIRIHNNIMRRQLRMIGGYEVKTEGDAFMVCFPTATSALLWCFSVQDYLLNQDWPDEILQSEGGREIQDAEGRVIYKGLSVRMGIHWGAPVCEPDPITGRMDYFGPMVNRAARISATADGGQITVSSDFVAEVNRSVKAYQDTSTAVEMFGDPATALSIIKDLRELSSQGFGVKELGERKLKGLENPEFIYLMYPESLVGRLQSKSAQKAVVHPKSTVNPDEIWALLDICHRLETLCSNLNTSEEPTAKPDSWDKAVCNRLRETVGEGGSDQQYLPILDHAITRIENCMTVLYLRRILSPNPLTAKTSETASPLFDLIDILQSRLGIGLGVGNRDGNGGSVAVGGSTAALMDIYTSLPSPGSSSPGVSPTTATPSIRSIVPPQQKPPPPPSVNSFPALYNESPDEHPPNESC